MNDIFFNLLYDHLLEWITLNDDVLDLSDDIWDDYGVFNLDVFNIKLENFDIFNFFLIKSFEKYLVTEFNFFDTIKITFKFFFKKKKILIVYLKYLYFTYNFLFIFNFKKIAFSLKRFRSFYDLFFMRCLLGNFLKFRVAQHIFNAKFFTLNNDKKINFKNFSKEYFPILSLFIFTDLCFMFKIRNLFLTLNFYNKVFLFHTTGIDSGHEGRKKQPIQVRSLSNIIWHLLFREQCTKINIKFLNFKYKALFFLTMLTHLQYVKRFKNRAVKFLKFIFELRQPYGLLKGKKLAVRKRFVVRKRSVNYLSFDKYENEIKKRKKMIFKKIRPICASLRDKLVVYRPRSKKFTKLLVYVNRAQGRDLFGNIVSYHKGGGNLFRYRLADYYYNTFRMPGIFLGYDYDNYRTGWVGLIKYINGCYGYILAASNMEVGSYLHFNDKSQWAVNVGSRVKISHIKKNNWIYNISKDKNGRGIYARAAGTGGLVLARQIKEGHVSVRLPSRKIIQIPNDNFVNLGKVSNENHFMEHFSKAGVGKIFNYRPHVRGEAMNAVDHHHGGKTKGGKKPKTPWGKIVVK